MVNFCSQLLPECCHKSIEAEHSLGVWNFSVWSDASLFHKPSSPEQRLGLVCLMLKTQDGLRENSRSNVKKNWYTQSKDGVIMSHFAISIATLVHSVRTILMLLVRKECLDSLSTPFLHESIPPCTALTHSDGRWFVYQHSTYEKNIAVITLHIDASTP